MAGWKPDSEEDERPLAEINVTPLVDVMLVLLVIFIILAPVMANSLQVTLPRAAGEAALAQTPLTLVMQADGRVWMDNRLLDESALSARLRAAVVDNPEAVVRIDGDDAVPYGRMARLLALIQAQGIRRIGFTTLRP